MFFGGADGDRTHDLSIANAALSQLSYGPTRGGYYLDLERVARASAAEPRRGDRFLAWGVSQETDQTKNQSRGAVTDTLASADCLSPLRG